MSGDTSSHRTAGVRRLVAVMSADIAGYSRLMGHDEEGTHARMTRYRRDVVEPTVAEHNGAIVKHMGDGFLATFDSPLEATRCAIVIQQTIKARNATVADRTSWLQYRIGINLGDVIVEPDDVFGDGVNVAARLQTAAEPGEVNISGGVYEQVKNKLVCGYQSLGDEKLKNITDPVRIYRVLPDLSAMARTDSRLKRLARVAIPMAGACALTFVIGWWYAGRLNEEHAAKIAPVAAATPSPAQVALAPPEPLRAAPEPAPSVAAPETRLAVAAPPTQAPKAGTAANAFRDCQNCPEMVKLSGGSYAMGQADGWDEKPVHQVVVAPFALGRLPVTMGEWRACVTAKGCKYEPVGDDELPVHNVSWDDARQYLAWLAQVTSKPYRLPTEAEWEYAARAGSTTSYWWGDHIVPGVANCKTCGPAYDPTKPLKVGLTRANPFGLQDMSGGVAEWVSDCWHSSYHGAPRTGSWDQPNCREHVLRGGSWRSDPDDVRVASRAHYDTGVRYPANGFRAALSEI